MTTLLSQFQGCLLGLACGDALCAPYEGGTLERLLWRMIGKTTQGKWRYTDDTQMTLDIATTFLKYGYLDQEALAQQFAHSYQWSRGYGPAASRILTGIKHGKSWQTLNRKQYKDGSFGNGAAMRAAILGLIHHRNKAQLVIDCIKVSEITHCHPLAIDGARVMAFLIYELLQDTTPSIALGNTLQLLETPEFQKIMLKVLDHLNAPTLSTKQIRQYFGNSISAISSVPSAVYIGLHFADKPFTEVISTCQQLGGDTDTIAAMAGAIWGTINGSEGIPSTYLHAIEQFENIKETSTQLYTQLIN